MAKPKLIVFDLDYTLWPFWIDTHVDPPFRKKGDGKVYDSHGRHVKCFRDVPKILERLHSEGYQIAVASRTSCTQEANQLIALYDWDKYFTYKEIYPGCKERHFRRFQQNSGFELNQMLFFDDEYRNIQDLTPFGVTCIYIDDQVGMTEQVLEDGLRTFAEKNKSKKN